MVDIFLCVSLMAKYEIDLKERFDTQVRSRLAAAHFDKDEAAAFLERLTKCLSSSTVL